VAEPVQQFNLALQRGETLGLIGESGSGKTLAMLAVMGLLPRNATAHGSIRLNGQELLGMGEPAWCRVRGSRIGMVFQEPMTALNPLQRVGDASRRTLAPAPQDYLRTRRVNRPSAGWSASASSMQANAGVTTRTSSRAASASASFWPARWRANPRC
jgi:ABC-type glutathione transport system ATPase component